MAAVTVTRADTLTLESSGPESRFQILTSFLQESSVLQRIVALVATVAIIALAARSLLQGRRRDTPTSEQLHQKQRQL